MTDPDTPYPPGIERTSVLAAAVGPRLAEVLDGLAALDRVPGLAPLVRWAPAGEGVSLVHRLPLGARTLTELREEGPLRLGAAAAIGRALVAPLRALHAAGLAHGAVGAGSVVVGSSDTEPIEAPVLAATGVGWSVPPGQVGGPDAAGDVAALAELVRHLVGIAPLPSGLVLVLLRCADDDPALRPTLDDLDRALAGCELGGDDVGGPPVGSGADALVPVVAAPRLASRDDSERTRPSGGHDAALRRRSRNLTTDATAGPATGSVLDQPRVLRPGGSRSRRRRAWLSGRPGWVLLGSALAAAVLLVRVVGPPTIAEGAAAVPAALGATAASPPTTTPTTSPTRPTDLTTSTPAPPPAMPPASASAADSDADTTGAETPQAEQQPPRLEPDPRIDPAPGNGRPSQAPAPDVPIARGSEPAVDWAAVLTALDRTRHAALVAGSRAALARAVDPQGPAWAADAALADRVRERGARLVGGEVTVVTVDLSALEERRARLTVVDTRAAYDVILDGTTARVPARGATTWTVVLTRASEGTWRIHDVRPDG